MSGHSEFSFFAAPATIAAVNRRIERESRLRVAALKRAKDPRPLPERIADIMLELAGSNQTVDRDALALRGFTAAELSDRALRAARDIANARAVRQVA